MTNKDNKPTPAPWCVTNLPHDQRLGVLCSIYGKHDEKHMVVGTTKNSKLPPALRIANAKRIVACVNFCEGHSDSDLAEMGSLKGELQRISDMAEATGKVTGLLQGVGSSQWHPYDKDNKETWPKTVGVYVVKTNSNGPEYEAIMWPEADKLIGGITPDWMWSNQFAVTHYMKITPPQEEGNNE